MLIGNYSVINKTPGLSLSGTSVSNTKPNWQKNGRNQSVFQTYQTFYSEPTGTEPPYSWLLAQVGGGLCSFGEISGDASLIGAASQGINLLSTLTGTGTIDSASLALIVSLSSALDGTGTISSAVLQSVSSLAAALDGTGTISSANMGAIVQMISELTGTGTISSATFVGNQSMSASIDIGAVTGITARDVWSFPVEGNYTAEQAMKLILSALAGKLSGAATTTVTIRDVNDLVDRIVATVDGDGNRSSVTLDVTD